MKNVPDFEAYLEMNRSYFASSMLDRAHSVTLEVMREIWREYGQGYGG